MKNKNRIGILTAFVVLSKQRMESEKIILDFTKMGC